MIKRKNILSKLIITLLLATAISLIMPTFAYADETESPPAWQPPSSVTVTLKANGGYIGSSAVTSKSYTFSAEKSMAFVTPSGNRILFRGWYTEASGGSKIDSAQTYFTESGAETPKILYAHWEKATSCKYNFKANGGEASFESRNYKYDKAMKKLPTISRARYNFVGWYTKPRGGNKVNITKKTKVTTKATSITLYAHWAPHQYFQFDGRWSGNTYSPTIASSGCGVSTTSMVVYTLAGKKQTPATAAKWSINHGYRISRYPKTSDGFFTAYPKAYNITAKRINTGDLRYMKKDTAAEYHKQTRQAVSDGNWVICYMGAGTWTHRGHFILWYETEGKRALVRDPNGSKASKTRNTVSHLQSEVIRYWVITVPDDKKLYAPQ